MRRIFAGGLIRGILFGWCFVANTSLSLADPSFEAFDRRAKEGATLSVVFFGGSLTWGANSSDPQRTSYRGLMGDYLLKKYPKSSITIHDAAIGGTGSKLGMFRLERDVLAYKPDLVFLDFTANDDPSGTDERSLASYEILLREMVSRGILVDQVFFGFKYNFGTQYFPEKMHRVIDHKKLAAAYHTATGDIYPLIQDRITSGKISIDTLWPMDSAHPDDCGYQLFFEAVRDGFEQAIADKRVCTVPDQPVFPEMYKTRQRIRLAEQPLPTGWKVMRTYRTSLWFDGLSSRWMGDVIACDSTASAGVQPITMKFKGTFVGLFGEADNNGLSFKCTIDGQPVMYRANGKTDPTEVWPTTIKKLGVGRLFIWRELSNQLSPGEHTLVITPIFPTDNEPAGQLHIESICVAGE